MARVRTYAKPLREAIQASYLPKLAEQIKADVDYAPAGAKIAARLTPKLRVIELKSGVVRVGIFGDPVAVYTEQGTGIYEERTVNGVNVPASRGPIRPLTSRFLVWIDPDTGEKIFAREVRGVRARHAIQQAAQKRRH